MFTFVAIAIVVGLGWYADRNHNKERPGYDSLSGEDRLQQLALHGRQDLKLIALLLGGILFMLGIIADRI